MSLSELLRTARRESGRLAVCIPEVWMQGRTAYGGLSAALAYEAARTAASDLPPLRAAQIAFIGPVTGVVEAQAKVERQGRNATWVRSELHCVGQLCLAATFVFMRPIESAVTLDLLSVDSDFIAPEQAELVPEQPGPVFLSQFENRRAAPLTGDGSICNWVRLKDWAEDIDPFTHLLVVGDGLAPGARTLMKQLAPVSSMVWQLGLLAPLPQTREGWWLLRSAADFAQAGCSTQAMHIWNRDGAPIVSGSQAIAIFG